MARKEKKLNVTVTFSSEPENAKDLADFFLLLAELDIEQSRHITGG